MTFYCTIQGWMKGLKMEAKKVKSIIIHKYREEV